MRLINVYTLELDEFFDEEIPEYAILSHTWGKDEVTFQDYCWLADYNKNRTTYASLEGALFQIGRNMEEKANSIRQRAGYEKIVQSARLAEERFLPYVWVDTCCIDKTSSAELSEAINSMFRWYEKSAICFAVLSDVFPTGDAEIGVRFADSRWFTRGWTLQELLAPGRVCFYDGHWAGIGEREPMMNQLHKITGIPTSALTRRGSRGKLEKGDFSLAQRMSWASKRQTSRKEDVAYCLLGLFDIHMPLLYGEGEKAFVRLQQEIIKNFSSQSLLAWGMDQPTMVDNEFSSFWPPPPLLTSSPAAFAGVKVLDNSGNHGVPFHFNNRGLEISLDLFGLDMPGIVYAKWDVTFKHHDYEDGDRFCLCIPLLRLGNGREDGYVEDGQEMIKCAHPVTVVHSRLPSWRSRKKILVVEHHRHNMPEPTGDFRYISFRDTFHYAGVKGATMVESFPQVFNDGQYCIDVTGGVLLFRYVVSDAYADCFSARAARGHRVKQFVVAVTFKLDKQSFESISESTAVCPWTGYTGHEAGSEGGPYVSLLDAFLGEEKLLDMSQWTNDRIMYNGRLIFVRVTAEWGPSKGQDRRVFASMSVRLID